jgi:CHASE3 domain sensor protein
MNGGSSHFNRRFLQVSFIVVPILIAGVLFFLSHRMYVTQKRGLNSIRERVLLQSQLSGIIGDMERMGSSSRGYFLTGDEFRLVPYQLSLGDVAIRFGALRYLGSDDQETTASIARLRSLVDARISELNSQIALMRAGADQQGTASTINRDLSLVQPVTELLSGMSQRQSRLLLQQRSAHDSEVDIREMLSVVLLFVSAAVVIVSGVLLLRIRELQSIITICAWTQRVNFNGKWMRMEEFLWERFRVKVSHGISEEAFEGVMGIVGKNLTVTNTRVEKAEKTNPSRAKPDSKQ